MSEEDAAWTQTFVTVTPQDDGILREIKESVVVSGAADAPLHLDTENIVMRRSLMSNANNFTNSAELEPLERTAVECQTYLQGVPKVELPLAYKDEATQTLYMRSDRQGPATVQSFGDMIGKLSTACTLIFLFRPSFLNICNVEQGKMAQSEKPRFLNHF